MTATRGWRQRKQVATASRVVVKVGSSSLTTTAGGIDPDRVRALVDALAGLRARGAEVVLVSSGAIAAGLAPLALARRPRDLATQQAAASVGQGLLVRRYNEEFARHGHHRRAGAAHRRRRHPAQPLPQRLPHLRQAAGARACCRW